MKKIVLPVLLLTSINLFSQSRANILWEAREHYKEMLDSCIIVGDKNKIIPRVKGQYVDSKWTYHCVGEDKGKRIFLDPYGHYFIFNDDGKMQWLPKFRISDINQSTKL